MSLPKPAPEFVAECKMLYERGWSFQRIANFKKCSPFKISTVLSKEVEVRGRTGLHPRTHYMGNGETVLFSRGQKETSIEVDKQIIKLLQCDWPVCKIVEVMGVNPQRVSGLRRLYVPNSKRASSRKEKINDANMEGWDFLV